MATQNSLTVTILLGKGDGTFTPVAGPAAPYNCYALVVADLNWDGKADLALADWEGGVVTILLGKGDGTFIPAASPTTGKDPQSIVVGDLNGDGIPDLALANWGSDTVTVLLGKGRRNL